MLSRLIRTLGRTVLRLPESLHRMGSPKAAAEAQHAFYEIYSNLASEGKFIQRISRSHPERKLAKVAEDFEEMLKHPMARRYLKTKPDLFVSELGNALDGKAHNAAVKSERIIELSRSIVEHLEETELKAILGHELGHLIAGHAHPQNTTFWRAWAGKMNQRQERMADQVGAILSGEGRALPSALEKIKTLQEKSMQQVSAGLPAPLRTLLTKARPDVPTRAYPSLHQRAALINKIADQIATPEGKSWVERLMARRLDTLHEKLR